MISPIEWLNGLHYATTHANAKILGESVALEKAFERIEQVFNEVKNNNKNIWWIGNGGSTAICSHLSQDVLNKLKAKSLVINDPSLMTCLANDFGYHNVFLKTLEIVASPGDLLIAISSAGKSESILGPVKFALEKKINVISMSGFSRENPLFSQSTQVGIHLPSELYGVVEVGHEAVLHSIIETMYLKNIRKSL